MKAIVCKEFGPPEKLVLEEVDDPVAGEGQLVIESRASTVTFPDALMIEDKYQFKAPVPFIPGGEAAGVVAQVGPGVEGFAVGDRVIGSSGLVGGFAEQVVAHAGATQKLPEALGFAAATGLLYAYGTGYYGLKHRGALKEGETLLVLGAAGNVGLAAIELGKLMGARVIAAASSPEKLAVCSQRGADAVIDYGSEDLKTRAKELTDGRGVDVVYDCIGGEFAEAAVRAIAWEGRFLVIGFTAGIPKLPLNLTLLKSCQVVGVFFGGMVQRQRDTSREDALDYAAARNIEVTASRTKIYSRDRNLWHISHEGGDLEDPGNPPPDDVWMLTEDPRHAPDDPQTVRVGYQEGVPVAVDGERLVADHLVEKLNAIGGRHGVGRDDICENRLVGMKSRGVYETPGGTIILEGLRSLRALTMERDAARLCEKLMPDYADIVYTGRWFTPVREAMDALFTKATERVTGDVDIQLYKGRAVAVSARSANSLFEEDLATFGESTGYDQADARGFIRLYGLPSKVAAAARGPTHNLGQHTR